MLLTAKAENKLRRKKKSEKYKINQQMIGNRAMGITGYRAEADRNMYVGLS